MERNPARVAAKWMAGSLGRLLHRTLGVVPAWSFTLGQLKARGFRPRTAFDIGVARGTPELYWAFPDAYYYLIDPTRESLPYMQSIAKRLNAQVLNLALGDREGELEIGVRPGDINGATFYEEIGPLAATERYPVPVRRFDQAIGRFERPALCKVDVQGAEIAVLEGMGERIQEIDVLIVEASVIATIKDGPEIDQVIAFCKQHGFVVYDVLGGGRRPLDRALAQLDLLFVKEDSPFRTDRRWSANA